MSSPSPHPEKQLNEEDQLELANKRARYSLVFPGFFLLLLWMFYIVTYVLQIDLTTWGIYPRRLSGLKGILFSPLIHGSLHHLFSNSVSLFILMFITLYFYRDLAYRVFILIWLMDGIWVWMFARQAYHIGASGLVYGLASFLFFSGIIRRHVPLVAISLLVSFLYGSMVWGLFPIVEDISWEAHLMGALAGLILALLYRHEGPQKPPPPWEKEDEEDEDTEDQGAFPSFPGPQPNHKDYQ